MEINTEIQTDVMDKKALSAVDAARAFVITTNELYEQADKTCVGLKGLEKEIIAQFADSKSKASQAHKAICALENKCLVPVVEARKLYKGKMSAYQDRQEQLRREEEDRQRLAAQKAAEDEAIRQAEQAKAEGKAEEAEEIIQAPVYVAPVVVPVSTPKASTVIRKMWTFKITNPALVPDQYKVIDESKLRKQALATGNSIAVPGVEFYQKPV